MHCSKWFTYSITSSARASKSECLATMNCSRTRQGPGLYKTTIPPTPDLKNRIEPN